MHRITWSVFLLLGIGSLSVRWCAAQVGPGKPVELPKLSGGILDQLVGKPNTGVSGQELTLTGQYTVGRGTRQGRLTIHAQISPGWHTYSTTQKPGGPQVSRIQVEPSPDFKLSRPFVADRAPHVIQEEGFTVLSDEFVQEVNWTAPFEIAPGADAAKLSFSVQYSGQVCTPGKCIPIRQRVEVKYAGEHEPALVGQIQPPRIHAAIKGELAPRSVAPGGTVRVSLTAVPATGYHVYAYAERDPRKISKPTLIVWQNHQGWAAGPVTASEQPAQHATGLQDEPVQLYHEKPVTWAIDLKVPADAAPGGYELKGLIGFQVCSDTACDLPTGVEFRGVVEVTKQSPDDAAEPLVFAMASYSTAAKLAQGEQSTGLKVGVASSGTSATDPSQPPVAGGTAMLDLDRLKPRGAVDSQQSMLVILPMALLAGFFLNFMPCVLPVIGLKLVSFVNQAGEHRSRIFMLNVWYCAGVLSVFMVLASLAVFFGLSWGDQFRSATFNIVLACVVFAFALSFLGVWEIPLPGFVGSRGVNSVAEREGYAGAFFKGALSTVLATPCGGPLLVPALTWAVAQPPAITYAGFACVGLGMAFPYLLVGAFPRLISLLPKPGDWMETFKHVMGFVLLGTVVFILSFIRISLVIPTVATMMGLWAGLWWVGHVPVWEELNKRVRAWAWGMATAAVIALFSFLWLDDEMESRFQREIDSQIAERMANPQRLATKHQNAVGNELPWQIYSHARLSDAVLSNGQTVFVDFTADWCATCKVNEATALNIEKTKSFVESNNIVTLKADLTSDAAEADELKLRLGGSSIPFYAVFPAASPYEPIVFDGLISTGQVLEALEQALSDPGTGTTLAHTIRGDAVAARAGGAGGTQ